VLSEANAVLNFGRERAVQSSKPLTSEHTMAGFYLFAGIFIKTDFETISERIVPER
jgi:hypothetical protein